MSHMGHFQTFGESKRMSGLPPEADIRVTHRYVRLGPQAEVGPSQRFWPLWAMGAYLDRCGEQVSCYWD